MTAPIARTTREEDDAAVAALLAEYSEEELPLVLAFLEAHAARNHSMWIGNQEPMPFDEFCVALDGIAMTPRQRQAFAETDTLRASRLLSPARCVQEFVLVWGKGSGKGYLSAKFIAWVAYVVNCIAGDPAVFFGLAPRSPLTCMNVAPSEDLARQVFFKYLRQNLSHPLFKPFAPVILVDEVRFFRPGPGGAPHEFLTLYSKHSRSSGIDGFNVLAFVMDEADAFLSTEKTSNAAEVHNILRSSAVTRMKRRWLGFAISYPRVEDGFMMGLYKRALKDMEKNGRTASYYCDLASTFEVRPDVSRDLPTIREDYENDPRDAMAKYDCIPMAVDEAFFETPERIEAAIDSERSPCARWRPLFTTRTLQNGDVHEFISAEVSGVTKVPGRSYFLAGDGGLSGDLFALAVVSTDQSGSAYGWLCPECGRDPAMRTAAVYVRGDYNAQFTGTAEDAPRCGACLSRAYGQGAAAAMVYEVEGWYQRQESGGGDGLTIGGRRVAVPHVYEELVMTFTPSRPMRPGEPTRLVDFPGVTQVCRQLITGLGVKRARFDPWSTPSVIQELQGAGADVDKIGFSNPEQYVRGRLVKAMTYAGMVTLLGGGDEFTAPVYERRTREWRKLVRKGVKLDHPVGGSKDIWDAESVAIWLAVADRVNVMELEWA